MRQFKSYLVFSFALALMGAALVFGQDIKPRRPAAEEPVQIQPPETRRDRARDLYYLADKSGEIL